MIRRRLEAPKPFNKKIGRVELLYNKTTSGKIKRENIKVKKSMLINPYMCHAFYFNEMSWTQFECVFGPHNTTCGDQSMKESALC